MSVSEVATLACVLGYHYVKQISSQKARERLFSRAFLINPGDFLLPHSDPRSTIASAGLTSVFPMETLCHPTKLGHVESLAVDCQSLPVITSEEHEGSSYNMSAADALNRDESNPRKNQRS
jgi:hypothetical protein